MTSRREETKVRQAIVGAPKKDLLGCDEAQLVVNAGWTLLADGTAKSERTRIDRWKRRPRTSHASAR